MKDKKSILLLLLGMLFIVAFVVIGFDGFAKKGDNTENTQTETEIDTQEDAADDTETETIEEITLEDFFGDSVSDIEEADTSFTSGIYSKKIATVVEERLYTRIGDNLYSGDLQGEQLSLVEMVQIPRSYQPFYDSATDTFYFVSLGTFTIDIYRMLENGTIELITQIEENSYGDRDPIIIEEGKCYYFSRERGFVLKAIDLNDPKRKIEIYRWEEAIYGSFPYIEYLQADNRYIIVDHEMTSKYAGVSVYDKKDLKWIIESDESIESPYYKDGKLYYLNRETAQICVINLNESTEKKELINLTKVGSDFKMLIDKDYLYVRNYDYTDEECIIDIYISEGELVDTITLRDNADALEREFHNNLWVSQVLYTTDDYIFVGEPSTPNSQGIFYFEKDKVGTEELIIYTLYLP